MLLLHPIQKTGESEYKKDKAPSDDPNSEVIMKKSSNLLVFQYFN